MSIPWRREWLTAAHKSWLCIASATLLCVFAYWPGLSGPFLFDDFANLPSLGRYGPVDDTSSLIRYVTSGIADPTGRPFSMLTFLLDARDWPAQPFAFKRTNLLLHLSNGILLYLLLLRLGSLIATDVVQCRIGAVFGASAWMLHPLWLSTTLYVVQRESILPTTFVLIGLLVLESCWRRALSGKRDAAFSLIGGLVVCTMFAVASKANGALLPLLGLVVARVVLQPRQPVASMPHTSVMRAAIIIGMWMPTLVLLAYLASMGWQGWMQGTLESRGWSIGERLLTEGRVVIRYLLLIWIPRSYSDGLFADDFEVSTRWLQPWTTLPSLAAVTSLIAAGIMLRRRAPAVSLALLFFFCGHLMESTVIGLELYFEHRNYLPAIFMFWPLGLWLAKSALSLSWTRVRQAALVCIPLTLAAMTWIGAQFWGDISGQANVWAQRNPLSARAQTYAALLDIDRGELRNAILRLTPALERMPDEPQIAFTLVSAHCAKGTVPNHVVDATEQALLTSRTLGVATYNWLEANGPWVRSSCDGLDRASYLRLLEAAKQNLYARQVHGRRQDMLTIQARMALEEGELATASALFSEALAHDAQPEIAIAQAALLAEKSAPCSAYLALNRAEYLAGKRPAFELSMQSAHAFVLWRQNYWKHEIVHLRSQIRQHFPKNACRRFELVAPQPHRFVDNLMQ